MTIYKNKTYSPFFIDNDQSTAVLGQANTARVTYLVTPTRTKQQSN